MNNWNNFLQNLGEWRGSFTKISPQGEILNDVPSVLWLERLEDNEKIRLTLRRYSGGYETQPDEMVREYNSYSLGREVLFFESGAFSQGTIQLAPYSNFVAEFGLIHDDRRMRLVQVFNVDGYPLQFTLIREKRANTNAFERPALTLEQLLGEWRGEAVTLYRDLRPPERYSCCLKLQDLSGGKVMQQIYFDAPMGRQTITSQGWVDGGMIAFDESSVPVRVLMLPDGASATFPVQVKLRQAFFIESGWLINPNLRQRMIRRYSDKGEWISLTLVTEQKIGNG